MSEIDDTDFELQPEDLVASRVSIEVILAAIGNILVTVLVILKMT